MSLYVDGSSLHWYICMTALGDIKIIITLTIYH